MVFHKKYNSCISSGNANSVSSSIVNKRDAVSLQLNGSEEWSVIDMLMKGWKDGDFDLPPVYITYNEIQK